MVTKQRVCETVLVAVERRPLSVCVCLNGWINTAFPWPGTLKALLVDSIKTPPNSAGVPDHRSADKKNCFGGVGFSRATFFPRLFLVAGFIDPVKEFHGTRGRRPVKAKDQVEWCNAAKLLFNIPTPAVLSHDVLECGHLAARIGRVA